MLKSKLIESFEVQVSNNYTEKDFAYIGALENGCFYK